MPDGRIVRIPSGANAGLRWRHRRAYVSGYWIGSYEPEMQRALVRWLLPRQRMFDVGGHAGFFTLLGARRVGRLGSVVALEPQLSLARAIREQAALNALHHVHVLAVAVGNGSGTATLTTDAAASSMVRVTAGDPDDLSTDVRVPLLSLDQAAALHGVPDLVKMDVEGAEVAALEGASLLLARRRTIWIIETHGRELNRRVRAVLQAARCQLLDLAGRPLAMDDLEYPHVVGVPFASDGPSVRAPTVLARDAAVQSP
jgi:FkbM family methyltransferase